METTVGKLHFNISEEDPWKHRSDFMKCKSCMWFVPKEVTESIAYHLGRCRRHAPTMNGYPVVYVNDWCGDHKVNEKYVTKRNG
jgi:hypothetical protein